jgi:hypothetical protein
MQSSSDSDIENDRGQKILSTTAFTNYKVSNNLYDISSDNSSENEEGSNIPTITRRKISRANLASASKVSKSNIITRPKADNVPRPASSTIEEAMNFALTASSSSSSSALFASPLVLNVTEKKNNSKKSLEIAHNKEEGYEDAMHALDDSQIYNHKQQHDHLQQRLAKRDHDQHNHVSSSGDQKKVVMKKKLIDRRPFTNELDSALSFISKFGEIKSSYNDDKQTTKIVEPFDDFFTSDSESDADKLNFNNITITTNKKKIKRLANKKVEHNTLNKKDLESDYDDDSKGDDSKGEDDDLIDF